MAILRFSPFMILFLVGLACQGEPSAAALFASNSASTPSVTDETGRFDHGAFDALLRRHVHGAFVDYAALALEKDVLEAYVTTLAASSPAELEKLPRAERMAFWINAYNAFTLRAIVRHYPIQSSFLRSVAFPENSIRQIPDVWDEKHRVAGADLSLNEIEHSILRPQFRDARVHFAVNCASIGCPPLRAEAFVGDKLEEQLDQQTRAFLRDSERNQIGDRVRLSQIFDWFGKDFGGEGAFEENGSAPAAVLKYLQPFATDEQRRILENTDPDDLSYLDYDWTLNDLPSGD